MAWQKTHSPIRDHLWREYRCMATVLDRIDPHTLVLVFANAEFLETHKDAAIAFVKLRKHKLCKEYGIPRDDMTAIRCITDAQYGKEFGL